MLPVWTDNLFRRIGLLPVILCLMLMTATGTANTAAAGDWMYRRSYFTGVPRGGQPTSLAPELRSRWAYRRPFVGTGFGFAVRGGYRINRIFIRNGLSSDVTVIREDWADVRP